MSLPIAPLDAMTLATRSASASADVGTDFTTLQTRIPMSSPAVGRTPSMDTPPVSKQDVEFRKVLQDFESVFLSMIWKQLRDTVPEGGILGQSTSEKLFRSMLDDEMSKNMAKAGGIGLASMMYRQMAPHVLAAPTKPGRLA